VTPFNYAASETRLGWTVGVGLEWAPVNYWSIKLEYDYLDFGRRTVTFVDPVQGRSFWDVTQRISEVKLAVAYRFH
jgi:opacity protein-like surface antigen